MPPRAAPAPADDLAEAPAAKASKDARLSREELREFAKRDPATFANEARERLAASDAPLAEKATLLRAAADADARLAADLAGHVFDCERPEPALRELALKLLVRASADPTVRERLFSAVVADRRASDEERRRAIHVILATAPQESLAWLSRQAERDPDPGLRLEALRGLAANPAPRARELLSETAASGVDPEAQRVARAALATEPASDAGASGSDE